MPAGKIADTNTRTNITIPKDLKAKLELIATEQNRSFNNLIITFIIIIVISSSYICISLLLLIE